MFWPPRSRRGGAWLLCRLHTRHVGHIAFWCAYDSSLVGPLGVSRTKKMHFEAGVFMVRRDFLFFFRFFSSNAHGLLQVWRRLALFNSLLVLLCLPMLVALYTHTLLHDVCRMCWCCCAVPGMYLYNVYEYTARYTRYKYVYFQSMNTVLSQVFFEMHKLWSMCWCCIYNDAYELILYFEVRWYCTR